MTRCTNLTRRRALQSAGVVVATALAAILPPGIGLAHEGHDHAPKTILDLKGKLVRIVRPDEAVTCEFIEDRVTIRVDAQGRILDLRYG
jgi:Peptidase inhibitor I78 family